MEFREELEAIKRIAKRKEELYAFLDEHKYLDEYNESFVAKVVLDIPSVTTGIIALRDVFTEFDITDLEAYGVKVASSSHFYTTSSGEQKYDLYLKIAEDCHDYRLQSLVETNREVILAINDFKLGLKREYISGGYGVSIQLGTGTDLRSVELVEQWLTSNGLKYSEHSDNPYEGFVVFGYLPSNS